MTRGSFIQFYGTSGSGKTTAMRGVMGMFDPIGAEARFDYGWTEKKTGKQRLKKLVLGQAYGYDTEPSFLVAGSYSQVCGGMDSLSQPGVTDKVYELLQQFAERGLHILMEGLIQPQPARAITLHKAGFKIYPYFLDTSLEVCLERINKRRAARGVTEPVDAANTTDKFKTMARSYQRLAEAGLAPVWCDGDTLVQNVGRILDPHA